MSHRSRVEVTRTNQTTGKTTVVGKATTQTQATKHMHTGRTAERSNAARGSVTDQWGTRRK